MVRPITDDDIGLKVLYDGVANNSEVEYASQTNFLEISLTTSSIIAVHGMGAHPDDTWCKEVSTGNNKHYVNWLQDADMLPAAVPNSRIMRYGYHSQWFGEDAIKTKASNISQQLLFDLKLKRGVSSLIKQDHSVLIFQNSLL
jgi:hypothetical protein